MNVHSYTILHYGKDYLSYALRSVYRHMDQLHVVYTPTPSHGHQTDAQPPETRDELYAAVTAHDPYGKLRWHDIERSPWEGWHRDTALSLCREAGAELVLVLDCDEVWSTRTLENVLAYVWDQDKARDWLLNFTTLWRSFNWVIRDDLWPVRLLDLRHDDGTAYLPRELGEVYHFGYAVRDEIMRYKWLVHGHRNELRPGWFETKWSAWPPPPDCHPTNERNFWMPEPFDRERLPKLMREHPFYGLEKIE
jgi:hypothetical protein